MSTKTRHATLLLFRTALGWMAVRCAGRTIVNLTFRHATPESAAAALGSVPSDASRPDAWARRLVRRLRAYALGKRADFRDLAVDTNATTPFQRRVYALCRRIPYGKTQTYGRLASLAGSPRAARAVGNCMSRNPVPLVVPCHRVVGAHGGLGGFSAPGGLRTKQALLAIEADASAELA